MAKNTIDLTPYLDRITDAIKQAIADGIARGLHLATDAATTPAKAPRAAKAAREPKQAGNGAPKRPRKPAVDLDAIAHHIGGVLAMAPSPMGMAALVASLPLADAKEIKRALPLVTGLVVTGKAKGTRYSIAAMADGDAPPMGSHVNGAPDASA